MFEQGGRSGIDLYARKVDAGDNHALEHVRQLFLVDVMLVEANPDGFGVDFDQFRQRVLQAARNRDGAALGGIEGRKFVACRFRGRIDRRARLVDDHITYRLIWLTRLLFELANERGDELFRFTRGGAVADGNYIDVVPRQQGAQLLLRLLGLVQVQGVRFDIFSRLIDYGEFTACAKAGIDAQDFAPAQWRLQQQIA